MTNITIPKLEKISVRLFAGDFKRLQAKYPMAGAGAALRVLLRNHLNRVDETPQLEVSLENLQGDIPSEDLRRMDNNTGTEK